MSNTLIGFLRYLPAIVPGIQAIKQVFDTFSPPNNKSADQAIVTAVREIALKMDLDPNQLIIVEDKQHQIRGGTGTYSGKTVLFVDTDLWKKDNHAARYFIKYSLEHISKNSYFKLPVLTTIISIAIAILIPTSYSVWQATALVTLAAIISYFAIKTILKNWAHRDCLGKLERDEAQCAYKLLNAVQEKKKVDLNNLIKPLKNLLTQRKWGVPVDAKPHQLVQPIEYYQNMASIQWPFPKN